jgi:hypothetical protein
MVKSNNSRPNPDFFSEGAGQGYESKKKRGITGGL